MGHSVLISYPAERKMNQPMGNRRQWQNIPPHPIWLAIAFAVGVMGVMAMFCLQPKE
jgi:hypothetical protein